MVNKLELARHPEKMREYLNEQVKSMKTSQSLALVEKLDGLSRKKYKVEATIFCLREHHAECDVYRNGQKEIRGKDIVCTCSCHEEAAQAADVHVEDGGPSQ
jgi:hypothetical protein